MSITRVFVEQTLAEECRVKLPEHVAHHVSRVLRMRLRDLIILFNGEGGEYRSRIVELSKSSVTVVVGPHDTVERESPLNLVLAQGISRGEKMDFTIRKAVELGVKTIVPLSTWSSTVRLDEERRQKRQLHWRNIVISACEQCGRNTLPELANVAHFSDWITEVKVGGKLILDPQALDSIQTLAAHTDTITLLVGPEGGFSRGEESAAEAAGFKRVRLGPRILRTETAAMAAVSVLQSLYGDLS